MATDWSSEVFRGLATGTVAVAAAFIGFNLADKGKRRDILYKERLESFKKLVLEIYSIRSNLILLGNDVLRKKQKPTPSLLEIIENLVKSEIYLELEVEKDLIFLKDESRKSISEILNNLKEFLDVQYGIGFEKSYLEQSLEALRSESEDAEYKRSEIVLWQKLIWSTVSACESAINALHDDLELPESKPVFKTRERFET